MKSYVIEIAGRELKLEFGELAGLADASVLVRYGDTVVLVTIVSSSEPREGIDFFPLNVDYEERLYAVGKIPGGFIKREGRPSEKAVLTSRIIDRPLRPLFPSDLRNDVSIVSTVLSVEQDNSPEFCAMIGAAVVATVSSIPFDGPVASVYVGCVDSEFIINPNSEQRLRSTLNLIVAGTRQKIVMIEAGACEMSEDDMFDAIVFAHTQIKRLCDFIQQIRDQIGKPKFVCEPVKINEQLFEDIEGFAKDSIKSALDTNDKNTRDERLSAVYDSVFMQFEEKYPRQEYESNIREVLYKLKKSIVRAWLLEGKRVDSRGMEEIRPLSASVGLLARTHGSGLFSRGQTQVLSVATLAPLKETQVLDGLGEEKYKRYVHHYNFPAFSVGETKSARSPGRREVGHGALAERALYPVLPSEDDFPYAIRVVSEVLSSNGSTSQGSVCASTLALMDAGVPIKSPVAGISVGLVDHPDGFVTMIDIQGLEDFFGDMDFKVAGTKKGITAIQMDIKTNGLTYEIIEVAFKQACTGRLHILENIIHPVISKSRDSISQYAPSIINIVIPVDKIREVIGQGGKIIQRITAETNSQIDIEDDGRVYIAATNKDDGYRALKEIQDIIKDPEIGEIYEGRVTKIMDFGAFVEFLPGKEGLLHVSKISKSRVAKVSDVLKEGDIVRVKLIGVDNQGRNNLSIKDI